jgi:hypothetical protein
VRTLGPLIKTDTQFSARVRADQTLVDGFAEDHREQDEDVLGALVGHVRPEFLVDPSFHRGPLNISHG